MNSKALYEGRGIAARETIADDGSGAIFANDKGETIELHSVIYFPSEGGRYENDVKGEVENPEKGRDKCVAAIAEWLESSSVDPENFKMVNATNMAAALSIWKDQKGQTLVFGRYATQIRSGAHGIKWPNSDFARETGYSSEDSVTKSENVALKPSDLFTNEPVTVPEMLTVVNNLPDTIPEDLREIVPAMLNAVARGEEIYVSGANEHRAVIEKYVGEYGVMNEGDGINRLRGYWFGGLENHPGYRQLLRRDWRAKAND